MRRRTVKNKIINDFRIKFSDSPFTYLWSEVLKGSKEKENKLNLFVYVRLRLKYLSRTISCFSRIWRGKFVTQFMNISREFSSRNCLNSYFAQRRFKRSPTQIQFYKNHKICMQSTAFLSPPPHRLSRLVQLTPRARRSWSFLFDFCSSPSSHNSRKQQQQESLDKKTFCFCD